ncbi:MAG TPA: ABC transporter ATP-binding protein [Bacteroidales bacterium]|nr:ABC transporter ATP-binding protein [Bacteroidales bacterium]
MLLELKNINVSLFSGNKQREILQDISFSLEKGETIGLAGESGSGKSMTAMAIMQLLPENIRIGSGEVLFGPGEDSVIDICNIKEEKLRQIRGHRIGMIFQEPMTSLNPSLTCGFQVAEPMKLHLGLNSKEARERGIELFNEVKLPSPEEIWNRYPHELSGGQKQRVMIAMAVSCNPSLLIADEPTTALDVTVQKNIIALLHSLRDKYGMGMIFISHDLGVISEIADKVAIMLNGLIVEKGLKDQLINHPQHPYTRGLLACRPGSFRYQQVPRLPTVQDFLDNHGNAEDVMYSKENKSTSEKVMAADETLFQVENLITSFSIHKNFLGKTVQEYHAVNDVSFSIFKGETIGLVGESGCGKTTLGRTLIKLIEAGEGKIVYKGQLVTKMSRKALRNFRREVQIIFQDPYSSLNPRLTIGQAIEEPMAVHDLYPDKKARRRRTEELISRVSLDPSMYNRYPHEFSGGQRQRIGIARALAVEPEFIICDESVSALDVSVQSQILNLLNELKEEFGLTYLFISHDLSVVRYMSDRIMVMKEGRIVESGDAMKIYEHPQSSYTRELIESIPG